LHEKKKNKKNKRVALDGHSPINMPFGGAAELGHNFHPGGRKTL
jgi:hypothetical protein